MNMQWLDFRFLKRSGRIPEDLGPHAATLRRLIGSTEKEFLMIGEKIQEFHGRANEISRTAAGIAAKISGREMEDVREGFQSMSALVDRLSGGMQSEKETIHLILRNFEKMAEPLAEFEKVVRILNVLCNFIKIEIARLGLTDTSFQKLAQDVQQMSAMITSKIKLLTDEAQAAVPALKHNAHLIETSNSRQQVQSVQILENVRDRMSAISAKHEESLQTISELSRTWKQITDHVGEIVQSLQFHDITRQRVEHVVEALDDLPHKLDALRGRKLKPSGSGDPAGAAEGSKISGYRPAELIADTFDLQAAQLQGADADLTEAVEKILQNLSLVATDAAGISEKIFTAMGQAGDRKAESFIAQLEKGILRLADSAGEMMSIKKDLASTMSAMSKTAEGMAVFAKDMEKIGIEMQRLALNARVHAAHLGDEGATLGVLAESIHQMSTDTSSRVSSVTSELEAVVGHAIRLSDMAGAQGDESRVGQDNIRNRFLGLSEPLKKMEDQINEMLPRIEKMGMELSADINRLLDGVQIHRIVSRDLQKVASYLSEKAASMAGVPAGRDRAQKKSRLLADLSSKYTMHRERTTHDASVQQATAKPKPALVYAPQAQDDAPLPPVSKSADEDLGDNVELF